jgi:polysaccharide export outer membrane protein
LKAIKNGVFVVIAAVMLAAFSIKSLAQSSVAIEQYRLGSGDVVKIVVFGQEDLLVETKLSNNGVINYPFLGDINLVGLTVDEVEGLIDTGLRGDYLVNPSVSVTVIEYRPFFIDGAVNKPGGYPYQPGLSVSKAAALAGGYTERANPAKVVIVRNISNEDVEIQATEIDIIFPGDIVTVKERFF